MVDVGILSCTYRAHSIVCIGAHFGIRLRTQPGACVGICFAAFVKTGSVVCVQTCSAAMRGHVLFEIRDVFRRMCRDTFR